MLDKPSVVESRSQLSTVIGYVNKNNDCLKGCLSDLIMASMLIAFFLQKHRHHADLISLHMSIKMDGLH